MALPFHPRLRFPFPARTPSWFAGHMARSLNELPNLLKDIDLVIEARDARLPLTSVNSAFDDVLRTSWGLQSNDAGRIMDVKGKQREKLVVYTKRDLAESRFEKVSCSALMLATIDSSVSDSVRLSPIAAEKSILRPCEPKGSVCRYSFG